MKRSVNTELFKRLVKEIGESAVATLAKESNVGISTVQKLMAGNYPTIPREALRERLCAALRISQDELFPLVDAKGKAS